MKILLAVLLTFLPSCYSHSPQLQYINDYHTYSLKWYKCPVLSTNVERAHTIFYMACMYGGFDTMDEMQELEFENVHQYLMSNVHGYARMELDDIQYTCMIEWGSDDFLNFIDFIEFFADNFSSFGTIMIKETIIRHAPPTKYDEAPFGTQCKVIHELSDTYDLWIQYSHDSEHPKWELMGTEIPNVEEKN